MWVQFKVKWQDGLYKYNPGKVVELPRPLAEGYCSSGKAKPCKPPAWAVSDIKKQKENAYPSARRRIKRMSSNLQNQQSLLDLANTVMDED